MLFFAISLIFARLIARHVSVRDENRDDALTDFETKFVQSVQSC